MTIEDICCIDDDDGDDIIFYKTQEAKNTGYSSS
jgi:hypothetical protein